MSKYPSPKGLALITPVRGFIVNATRCELRVAGFGLKTAFCYFINQISLIILYHRFKRSLLKILKSIRVNSILN